MVSPAAGLTAIKTIPTIELILIVGMVLYIDNEFYVIQILESFYVEIIIFPVIFDGQTPMLAQHKAAANATGYDVVLGTSSKKENGETRPYNYGAHKVLNLKEGTVTATFKNVPKGTWTVGMHAFNRTSEDGKKVFSPWSNLKKATVK